jgi:quercetin dioxygenase-like cupin family protein
MFDLTADGPLPTYQQIKHFEQQIVALGTVELEFENYYIPGVYLRKLKIPQGTPLVGKIHATLHMCVIAKGRIAVASETGRAILEAGEVFLSEPGTKRVGYALEDCVFINVHSNKDDDTDLAVLESKLITPELIGYDKEELCLG